MSESKKLLIGFAVIGLLFCCVAGIVLYSFWNFGPKFENIVSQEPDAVVEMQENIASFDIPDGYEATAMSMLVYDMITLTPDSSHEGDCMIMLMQYSSVFSGNAQEMEEQIRKAAEQQTGQRGTSMQVVDTIEKVIRGETVTVTVSESEDLGLAMRQWMTIFQGNKGPTILMIMGSVGEWDDQLVDDFINSIR